MQASQEVAQCQLWTWVGGKRPLWQTWSLGARPQPAWAEPSLPRTPLWINTEVRSAASPLLRWAVAPKGAEELGRGRGEPGPHLGEGALRHLLFWH